MDLNDKCHLYATDGKGVVVWESMFDSGKQGAYVVNTIADMMVDSSEWYQSCHAIVKQDDSHYMIKLAPFFFENMSVTSMDITKCSYCVPSFSNKKIAMLR